MNRVPRWRIAAALLIVAVLASVLWTCAPHYLHNLSLQEYVSTLTRSGASPTRTDREITDLILQKAVPLRLPVAADNVHITRQKDGTVQKIDVRYVVPVKIWVSTINLHFYPSADRR